MGATTLFVHRIFQNTVNFRYTSRLNIENKQCNLGEIKLPRSNILKLISIIGFIKVEKRNAISNP